MLTTAKWIGPSGDGTESGRFADPGNWSTGTVPDYRTIVELGAGDYTVTTTDPEVRKLDVGPGVRLVTSYTIAANTIINHGTLEVEAEVSLFGQGPAGIYANTIKNYGVIKNNPGNDGVIDNFGQATTNFQNYGTVEADAGSTLAVNSSSDVSNHVLLRGTWIASDATLSLSSSTITELARGAHVILEGRGASFATGAGDWLQSTLTKIDVGASLQLGDEFNYALGTSLDIAGTLTLHGGTLSGAGELDVTGTLAVDASGALKVADVLIDGGVFRIGDDLSLGHSLTVDGGSILVGDHQLSLFGATALDDGRVAGSNRGALVNNGALTSTGTSSIGPGFYDNGTVTVQSGELDVLGTASGKGKIVIAEGATLDLAGPAGPNLTLSLADAGARLVLGGADGMKATLRDFGSGDSIDLQGFARAGETLRYTSDGKGGGTVLIQSGSHAAALHLAGSYQPNHFHLTDDDHGGTYLTYDGDVAAFAASLGG